MLSCCLIVACQPDHDAVSLQESNPNYALFEGAGPTQYLSFGNTNPDLQNMHISFEDVGHRVEHCEKLAYHLCIESPFEIYVPKKVGDFSFRNTKGEIVDVAVTTHKNEAHVSQVCELNNFWISVKNGTSKYTSNFHFNRKRGLIALFETLQIDGETYEPTLAYSLSKGNVFDFDELCKKPL